MIKKLKQIVNRMIFPNTYSNERFCEYLREKGAQIGNNVNFVNPKATQVDVNRGNYISIGDNCCLSAVSIIAHDYSWYVLGESHGEIYPDGGGRIKIGNNVFIGYRSIILKGVTIGDNSIIGAGSVVTKDVPKNTVWAGNPAKYLMSLDEYRDKKIKKMMQEAATAYDVYMQTNMKDIPKADCGFFAFLFLERTEKNYEEFIRKLPFNAESNSNTLVKKIFFETRPKYASYEEFLAEIRNVLNGDNLGVQK